MDKLGLKCKQLMSTEIARRVKGNSNLFITSFNMLSVPDQEQLRKTIKEINGSFLVVKNRIAKQAFGKSELKRLDPIVKGLTALAGGDNAIDLSKALVNFARKHENFKILGAYIDQQLLGHESVKELAAIPSREVLLAQFVCGLNAPIQGLVFSLSGIIKKFILVLDKIKESKQN